MESITLETINNSINGLNHRIGDLNNRVNESNNNMRTFIIDNTDEHTAINKKIDHACNLISNIDKKVAVTCETLENHLETHKKEDERMNINGIKFTSLFGHFISAVVGALTVIYANGLS